MKSVEPTYIQETVIVIRPTTKNQIWNEQDYEVLSTYDKDGNKIVLLKEIGAKEVKEDKPL